MLEFKAMWAMTNLLDLSMDRAMICLLNLGLALIMRSKLVRRTSGVAIVAVLVILDLLFHICHKSGMCNNKSDEVKQRVIGAKRLNKQQTLGL
jgi:hypothetical protein